MQVGVEGVLHHKVITLKIFLLYEAAFFSISMKVVSGLVLTD